MLFIGATTCFSQWRNFKDPSSLLWRSPRINTWSSIVSNLHKRPPLICNLTQCRRFFVCWRHKIEKWSECWRLKFNAEKCKVLSVTRKRHPLVAEYLIKGEGLQHVSAHKDLGVTVCSDLKWNTHIYEQVTKANRVLDMINPRRSLYLTLVRPHLAYASQVWCPQSTTTCMELERVQRRATKFVLGLPFQTDMPYKTRLVILKILPLCYWHEYLDNFFLFKCTHGLISTNLLPEVDTLSSNLNLRSSDDSLIKYNIPKVTALSDQNSYLIRVSRAWN